MAMVSRALAALGPAGFHRLAYTEWGEADNPRVVLCIHGLTRNGRDFDHLARALAADCRVLCPDVAGRGASDWLPDPRQYTYPQYAADMAALIARAGVEQVDVVGTSMGGIIGMVLASQTGTPVRRLVLNDVGAFLPKAVVERIALYTGRRMEFPSLEAVEAYLRQVHAPFGPLSDGQWRHLAENAVRPDGDGWRLRYDPGIAVNFAGNPQDVDMWPLWDRVRGPTLLLRGAESDLLSRETAEEMTRRGPGAELVEFPGIGHAPALMSDDQIAVVRDWLGRTH